MKRTVELHPLVRRFVEDAGSLTQTLGVGRVLGQVYAYLYFSRLPRSLGNMQETLGISKGSASIGVRQLEQWGAVRKVWVRGDRKDYYEANDWFGQILKNAIADMVRKRMSSYTSLLGEAQAELRALAQSNGEGAFIRQRVERLQNFHGRVQRFWSNPLLQALLR
jgi:HTH-type transcriptional regulator, glycine betaine synthesis regulator